MQGPNYAAVAALFIFLSPQHAPRVSIATTITTTLYENTIYVYIHILYLYPYIYIYICI